MTLFLYDLPSYATQSRLVEVVQKMTGLQANPILTKVEGKLPRARVTFETVALMEEAAEKMRYFELFSGSNIWSYSLGFGK